MQLPFSIDTGVPRWARQRTLTRRRLVLALSAIALGAAGLAGFSFHRLKGNDPDGVPAALQITSVPSGAWITVAGRDRGQTPVTLALGPGNQEVRLQLDGYAEASYRVRLTAHQSTALAAELWLAQPRIQPLRPTYPGARIEHAAFLADGRVSLLVGLPPGDEKQLWLLDATGDLQRRGPARTRGSLAPAPDGRRVAYLVAATGSSANEARLTQVWISNEPGAPGVPRYELPAAATAERLIDLSWAPTGQHLLLVSAEQAAGIRRTHLRLLDLDAGAARDLVSLPSDIVPGSYAWRPDGHQLAFLTQVGQLTSLCLLSTQGEFHYLADLSRDDASPLPFPPIAWSPAGDRLVYAGLTNSRSAQRGWLFGPSAALGLFSADAEQPVGERLREITGQAPVWRRDGTLLTLARPKLTGPITLQDLTDPSEPREMGVLPLKAGSAFAARWDAAHAQALLAIRGATGLDGGQPSYFLVRYRDHADAPAPATGAGR